MRSLKFILCLDDRAVSPTLLLYPLNNGSTSSVLPSMLLYRLVLSRLQIKKKFKLDLTEIVFHLTSQGSAADVAMCAMIEIERNTRLKELGWTLLLQVYIIMHELS